MRHATKRGLASWSIHHPIGTVMITLAFMVLGLMARGLWRDMRDPKPDDDN